MAGTNSWNYKLWKIVLMLCVGVTVCGSSDEGWCTSVVSKLQTRQVSYSSTSTVKYYNACGFLWLSRCTRKREVSHIRYRVESKTVNKMINQCCRGWVSVEGRCEKVNTSTSAPNTTTSQVTAQYVSLVSDNNVVPPANTTVGDGGVISNKRRSISAKTIGAIAGIIGGLVILIAVVVIVVFICRRRENSQSTIDDASRMLSNRTYGMTEIGGNGVAISKNVVAYENIPREPPEGHEASELHDDATPTELSSMYAEVRKDRSKSKSEEDQIPIGEENVPNIHQDSLGDANCNPQAGWKENDIYDTSADGNNDNKPVPKISEDKGEGWVDNSFYSSSASEFREP